MGFCVERTYSYFFYLSACVNDDVCCDVKTVLSNVVVDRRTVIGRDR
jgi:hypothetical protein